MITDEIITAAKREMWSDAVRLAAHISDREARRVFRAKWRNTLTSDPRSLGLLTAAGHPSEWYAIVRSRASLT